MDSPGPFPAIDDDRLFSGGFRLSIESDQGERAAPTSLPLPLPRLDSADALLWNLISPCSEDELLEEIPIDSEPLEKTQAEEPQEDEEDQVRYASSSDDGDEEVEVFNAETEFTNDPTATEQLFRRSSSLDSKAKDGSEVLDSVTEADELDDLEVSSTSSSQLLFDDSTSEDGSIPSQVGAKWAGRVKARTYSGSASVKMHQAYDKLRARTRSATASLRHASPPPPEDDGGFSSDDEDYDHERASRARTPPRVTSFSFPTRLTAVKNNLHLPKKMPSMMRFRSSSSGTTSSEDSYVGSNGSLHSETKPPPAKYNTQELKHKATVCASRAAGLLGAASAEAARKLRTTRAFRSSSQPTRNRHVASSPVVDRLEESPGLPPMPARSAVLASRASE